MTCTIVPTEASKKQIFFALTAFLVFLKSRKLTEPTSNEMPSDDNPVILRCSYLPSK
jgi:hypothetical protein